MDVLSGSEYLLTQIYGKYHVYFVDVSTLNSFYNNNPS